MSVRRAIVQTFVSRNVIVAVNAATLVVLARLLEPATFGVFAAALVAFTILSTVSDFGLKAQLVRAEHVGRDDYRSAAGLSWAISWTLAAGASVACAAMDGGLIPNEAATAGLLLAGVLLFKPVVTPLEAMLERDIKFGLLSALAVGKAIVRAVVTIALALSGFEVAALAAGVLVEEALAALVLGARVSRDTFPRPRVVGWSRYISGGWRLLVTQLVPKAGEAGLIAVLGGMLGMASLGLFNRADRIVRLFDDGVVEGIKPVVLPALSRSIDAGVPPADLYLGKIALLAGVCWPAFAVIAVLAEPLSAVLLGPGWPGAASVVQALALIGVAKPFTKMSFKLFIAIDRLGDMMRIQTAHQVLRVVLATLGALVSLEGACVGLAAALAVKAIVIGKVTKAATGYEPRKLRRTVAQCGALTLCAVAGPIIVLVKLPGTAPLPILAFGLALAAAGWLAAVAALGHPLGGEVARGARALCAILDPAEMARRLRRN